MLHIEECTAVVHYHCCCTINTSIVVAFRWARGSFNRTYVRDCFLLLIVDRPKVRERELAAKFDKYRDEHKNRKVGMLNPMRDKNDFRHMYRRGEEGRHS